MSENHYNVKKSVFSDISRGWQYVIVSLMLALVYIFVYFTGGIKYAYSHLMYLCILFAGFAMGTVRGLITGIIAGILLGPLMPIDTATGVPQSFFNWAFRLLIFSILGCISGYVANMLRKNINTIEKLYSHNSETGIPNIHYLKEIKADYSEFIVFTIYINNYVQIMDLLGMDIYNKVLQKIYIYLKRDLDSPFVIQADSNKIWLTGEHSELYSDIYKVLFTLKQPLNIDDIPFYVEFSLGVDISNADKITTQTFKKSDIAGRFAQKNNLEFAIYDRIQHRSKDGFALIGVFLTALAENQTTLVYQPKFDINTGEIIGAEALIRWLHPEKGLIMPNEFIPLIEETQLIHQLTAWVFKKTLIKIKEFIAERIEFHISINISVKNLLNRDFYNQVAKIIKMEKVDPKLIEFEITESELMINPEECAMVLQRFKHDGFQISIDDFGKGHSSLSYLSQLPITILKLDKGFIDRLKYDVPVRHIVSGTIDLAHKLNCKTLAEGIEDEETLQLLKELDCDYAQGYYLAKPIPANDIIDWVKNRRKDGLNSI